jgi:hypothetical protein
MSLDLAVVTYFNLLLFLHSSRTGIFNIQKPGATFTFSYRLPDLGVINYDNLLKLSGNLIKILAR